MISIALYRRNDIMPHVHCSIMALTYAGVIHSNLAHGPYSGVPFFGAACFYRAPGTTMNGCSTTWERDSWGEQHYGSATSAANCAARKVAYDEWCGTTRSQVLRPDTSKCNPVQALVLLAHAHIMAWCLPNTHIIRKCMISVAPIRRYVTIPTASLLLL